jgi:hypothetical protein
MLRSQIPTLNSSHAKNFAALEKAAIVREHARPGKKKDKTEVFNRQLAEGIGHAQKLKKTNGESGGTDTETAAKFKVADC